MQRIMLLAGLAALAGSAYLLAQRSTISGSAQINSQDRTFIDNAAKGNQEEIEIGQLAEQKTSNSMVKSFGQKIMTDHKKNQQELKDLAAKTGVSIAAYASATKPSASDTEYQKLSGMSGSAFDRAFAMQEVQDHEKNISEFEQELKNTSDTDLRNYINSTLPVLRSHLDEATSLQKSLGKG